MAKFDEEQAQEFAKIVTNVVKGCIGPECQRILEGQNLIMGTIKPASSSQSEAEDLKERLRNAEVSAGVAAEELKRLQDTPRFDPEAIAEHISTCPSCRGAAKDVVRDEVKSELLDAITAQEWMETAKRRNLKAPSGAPLWPPPTIVIPGGRKMRS